MLGSHNSKCSTSNSCVQEKYYFDISIPFNLCLQLYEYSVEAKQKKLKRQGFVQGNMPKTYIEKNFFKSLSNSTISVLYFYYLHDYIIDFLQKEKLTLCFNISIKETIIDFDNKNASITLEVPRIANSILPTWKEQKIRFPQRKKYKDLDRQAELFVLQEESLRNKHSKEDTIHIGEGDWVLCAVTLLNFWTHEPILSISQKLWFFMSSESIDLVYTKHFFNKKIGDVFTITSQSFLEILTSQSDIPYAFEIQITSITSNTYFDTGKLKKYFKIKSQEALYNKIIEVFSLKKDITQRRLTVQLALNLMRRHHLCTIPRYIINQEAESIFQEVAHSSDYLMYHSQKDFKEQVYRLAIKNIYEKAFIDKFSSTYNTQVSLDDISTYCNFLQRNRLKDFIYFNSPISAYETSYKPIHHKILELHTRREKTINTILFTLAHNKKT